MNEIKMATNDDWKVPHLYGRVALQRAEIERLREENIALRALVEAQHEAIALVHDAIGGLPDVR